MPYARNAGRPQLWRRFAKGRVGLRGLGQACADGSTPDAYGFCASDIASLTPVTGPNENSPLVLGGNYQQPTVFPIGSTQACGAGYVVGDSAGNCVPISSLATTLASPGGATALGLTPSAAAAVTASLNAVKAALSTTSAIVAPAPASFLSSISPTTWLLGAGLFAGVLLLFGKRR